MTLHIPTPTVNIPATDCCQLCREEAVDDNGLCRSCGADQGALYCPNCGEPVLVLDTWDDGWEVTISAIPVPCSCAPKWVSPVRTAPRILTAEEWANAFRQIQRDEIDETGTADLPW